MNKTLGVHGKLYHRKLNSTSRVNNFAQNAKSHLYLNSFLCLLQIWMDPQDRKTLQ